MADTEAPGGTDGPQDLDLTPTAEPAPHRRRRTLALWGVLAVLAVGVGALAINARDDDPPRLPVALGSGGSREAAPATADMAMLAPIHYVAGDDLPLLGGSDPAYKLSGTVTEARVRELGKVFGATADPVHEDGSWRVATNPGELDVYEGGGGQWWWSKVDPSTSVSSEIAVEGCAPDAKCIPTTTVAPSPPADLPTKAGAEQSARNLFHELGRDLGDAKVTVDGPYDAWFVTFEPRIDGRFVGGLSYTASVGSHGAVQSAGGWLNAPAKQGDYPVIDTRAAIDRLNDQTGYATDVARDDLAVTQDAGASTTVVVPPDAGPTTTAETPSCVADLQDGNTVSSCGATGSGGGSAPPADVAPCVPVTTIPGTEPAPRCLPPEPYVPPEPKDVVLHSAERILVLVGTTDGSTDSYLVPGYRMRGDDDTVVDVPSVDDDSLLPPAGRGKGERNVPDTAVAPSPTDITVPAPGTIEPAEPSVGVSPPAEGKG